MSTDEPEWDLLPHAPQAFFGLADGYDRKDLKRAYNALIRRYKPEKCPQEFQRIRAAYEQLDQRLRYGRDAVSGHAAESLTFDWQPLDASSAREGTQSLRSSSASTQSGPTLPERVESESPRALFAELTRKQDKSPYDYYCLAVLSDVTQPEEQLSFAKWLMKGLKRHAREPGLLALLQAYFHSELPIEHAPKLLKAASQVISDDRFFYLTEPLWDRLLRDVPFEKFRKLLAECEANLLDHRIQSRLTFYLHLLKPAFWIADESWIEATLEFLEENSRSLPRHLESEIEFAWDLREYIRSRTDFLNGNSLRAQIDQAIRDYCTCEAAEADRTFLECQLRMATEPDDVLNAFPVQAPHLQPAFVTWNWIISDVAERYGTVPNREETRRMFQKVRRMVKQIDIETDTSWFSTLWSSFGWGYFLSVSGISVVALIAPFVVLNRLSERTTGLQFLSATAGGIVCLALFWFLIKPYAIERLRIGLAIRIAKFCYVRLWRRRIVDFLMGSHLLSDDVAHILDQIEDSDDTYLSWVRAYYGQDFALPFFSIAQQFLV